MTSWGFDTIKADKPQDKLARGGKMHQLLDIAFPGFYKENSVWKLFPFTTSDEIKRIFDKQGVAGTYDFSSPPQENDGLHLYYRQCSGYMSGLVF
jgi:hypothetical protein